MALQSSPSPSLPERLLWKSVPLWLVLAMALFSLLATVSFGWLAMRSAMSHDERPLARAAVEVASFPTTAKAVFQEVARILSGKPDYARAQAHPPDRLSSGFQPVQSTVEGVGAGLIMRRGPGALARGWRIIVGAFKAGRSVQHVALMLSPDLRIVHHWPLLEDGVEDGEADPTRKLTHGFSVLTDGSVIYAFEAGKSLHKKDWCGHTIWAAAGRYHHSVTVDDTETTVWALRHDHGGEYSESEKIVQLAVEDGKIVKEISIADIIAANPDIDILEVRRDHQEDVRENARGLPGPWLSDPFHLNDVDPLPRNLADAFPQFAPGDLLVSVRNLNLLFVVDPRTLAVKWWRAGATIRQHDPDWMADGRISAYDNRMTRGYSEIVEIDPATLTKTVPVDGRNFDFYSRARGEVEAMPGGGWLIASPGQGRAIELSPDGKVALEFYDVLDEKARAFGVISQAVFLPEGSIDIGAFQCRGF
ncbi:MAG TPA: arylsulfotransferase family protein [Dongiaceae bacterium]|nr:arylsulfotransferase family protein [Dongiaceae bacterium]